MVDMKVVPTVESMVGMMAGPTVEMMGYEKVGSMVVESAVH